MSVLIKGMIIIPKCCCDCRFTTRSEYSSCLLTGDFNYHEYWTRRKLNNCPLIEVPEKHGRLIDADALCADIAATVDPIYSDMIEWAIGMVAAQSTVIEAEDE